MALAGALVAGGVTRSLHRLRSERAAWHSSTKNLPWSTDETTAFVGPVDVDVGTPSPQSEKRRDGDGHRGSRLRGSRSTGDSALSPQRRDRRLGAIDEDEDTPLNAGEEEILDGYAFGGTPAGRQLHHNSQFGEIIDGDVDGSDLTPGTSRCGRSEDSQRDAYKPVMSMEGELD